MSKLERRLRAVVFDAFGTLIQIADNRRPYRRLQSLMQEQGRRPKPDDALLMLTSDADMKGIAAICGVPLPVEALTLLEADLAAEVASVELFQDAEPALATLREVGLGTAVCSNLAKPYGAAVRRLLPSMDAYSLSYEVGAAKPDPLIYADVCETLGCPPDELLFVGDTLSADFTGPRAFGMAALHLVREGPAEVAETIGSLSDLIETLRLP